MEDNGENQKDDPRFSVTPLQQMAAACSGGIVTSFFMTPLDVVKIRLQAQQKSAVKKCFLYCNGLMDHYCICVPSNNRSYSSCWYTKPSHFNGTLDAFIKITRQEGVLSLWSGLSPTLVLALPATIVYFVTYDQLKFQLKTSYERRRKSRPGNVASLSSSQPLWIPLLSGCTARVWAATCVSPLELIRTKMQSKKLTYTEMKDAVSSLIRYHGFLGLWKGLAPTLMRDVPFSGIYWVTYETVKSYTPHERNPFLYSFAGGCVSGTVAATITTPFDVLKTIYQIDIMDKEIMTERRSTMMAMFKKIYSNTGIKGLFAGLGPRLAKVVPACAIMISSFEYGKSYFYRSNAMYYARTET